MEITEVATEAEGIEASQDSEIWMDRVPLEESLPVGARLMKFWRMWEKIGADPSIVQIIQQGYRLEFSTKPKLTIEPWEPSPPISIVKQQAVHDQIQKLLEKKVIETVQNRYSSGFYNRFFVVPKKQAGAWKSILDLRQLNAFIVKTKFKMETAETIRQSLEKGHWITSLDFSDAYFHIMIHPRIGNI